MRTLFRSLTLPLALFAVGTALPWTACTSEPPAQTAGTEAAGDAGSGGHGSTGTDGAGGAGGVGVGSPIEARFDVPTSGAPDFLAVPFPSDLYLGANGLVADVPMLSTYVLSDTALLVEGLKTQDGFGTTAGAIFAIDDHTKPASGPAPAAKIDVATLPATEADSLSATASVMLVDLEAAPGAALVPARADYHDDAPNGATARPLLVVYPARGVVLQEKHHYAAVLTTAVHVVGGAAVGPSLSFRAVRDGAARDTPGEKLYGEAVATVVKLVPALADKTKIAALAVYTTHGAGHELVDIRAQIANRTAPDLQWTKAALLPMGPGLFANTPLPAGYTATLDAWLGAPGMLGDGTDDPADDQATGRAHEAIAAIGTAVFDAPNFLRESAKGYSDPTHHTFARDSSGTPIPNPAQATAKVWMTIALPKGPVPKNGFPVIVVQHGLGGDRSILLSIADTFAKKGWASVAIETVTFGARAAKMENTSDAAAGFPWSAGGYNGPDGFVDTPNGSSDFFGGLANIGAIRDQMRQSVVDLGTAVDVVRSPALDLGPLLLAVPGAKLDASKMAYLGNSLGGLMGAMLAAIDPHLTTFVLNVAGGGLMTELAPGSPNIASSLESAGALNFGFGNARFAPGHPLLHLLQHVVDAGDPLLYAGHILTAPYTINGAKNPPKSVIQIEAVLDATVCNEANEALARAAGFALAAPSLGSQAKVPLAAAAPVGGVILGAPMAGITAVLVQASPATHSSDLFSAMGSHHFEPPYGRFDTLTPFPTLPADFAGKQPYLGLQTMMTEFFATAFTGGVPEVKGFPTPIADFDGDGVPDATDTAPYDPSKQ